MKAAKGRGVGPARVFWTVLLFGALAAAALMLAVVIGETSLDLSKVFEENSNDAFKASRRLRRAIAAFIVGGGLSVAGLIFQALIRNPLASPYVLGVSAGGSLGAVVALVAGISAVTPMAFLGAILAILLVYGTARSGGRVPASTLLLSGVIVNAFCTAAIMLLNLLASPDDQSRVIRWLVGGLRDYYGQGTLLGGGLAVLAGASLAFMMARHLNLISLGDVVAERSGVRVTMTRTVLFLLASLLTAVAVSISGPIGFVGLLVPHGVRLCLGPDHRLLVPAATLAGGAFLVGVDVLARTIWVDHPLPAGVVTAFLGGPAFLLLLSRADRSRAGLDG